MQKSVDERIQSALDIAFRYGSVDGAHHKAWLIDQMVRDLTGDKYEEWVARRKEGHAGPSTYSWDTGIAP